MGGSCGAPTYRGGLCRRPSDDGYCRQHRGRTAVEWEARHDQKRANRGVYLATKRLLRSRLAQVDG